MLYVNNNYHSLESKNRKRDSGDQGKLFTHNTCRKGLEHAKVSIEAKNKRKKKEFELV